MIPFLPKPSGVGVVEIFGPISGGARVAEQARLLEVVRTNKKLKALLLDIDSPGGAVGASEALYAQLQRTAKTKPVVAFVRGLGASGAYLLSCAAAKIVTVPSALVGSIGVLYVRPTLTGLMERAGVELSVYRSGRLKDMTGFWRGATAEEDAKFEGLLKEIHDAFIESVASGRNLDVEAVRELATGEAFTGRRAKEMGLVDEIGDFNHALTMAAVLGDAKPNAVWVRPKRGFMERLAGNFGRSMMEGAVSSVRGEMPGGLYYGDPWFMRGQWRL